MNLVLVLYQKGKIPFSIYRFTIREDTDKNEVHALLQVHAFVFKVTTSIMSVLQIDITIYNCLTLHMHVEKFYIPGRTHFQ